MKCTMASVCDWLKHCLAGVAFPAKERTGEYGFLLVPIGGCVAYLKYFLARKAHHFDVCSQMC